MRRWTINAKGGAPDRYFATRVRDEVLDLELSYRDASGNVRAVGSFRLPMSELAAQGSVRERDDGDGYDIQIRMIRGEPWLALNESTQTRMHPHRR
ncbi:MAG: hypothetical protein EP330_08630 [Deltaproteobacteria bacterium]|nr:MAG: hypothetical protein EP330_08630 [Deltaproteobacteria bacterium]